MVLQIWKHSNECPDVHSRILVESRALDMLDTISGKDDLPDTIRTFIEQTKGYIYTSISILKDIEVLIARWYSNCYHRPISYTPKPMNPSLKDISLRSIHL